MDFLILDLGSNCHLLKGFILPLPFYVQCANIESGLKMSWWALEVFLEIKGGLTPG